MADITKCSTRTCPKMNSCYRFTAPNSHWQAWANFESYQKTTIECLNFIDNKLYRKEHAKGYN